MFHVILFLGVISSSFCEIESKNVENFKIIILHNNDLHSRFDQINSNDFRCSKEEAASDACFGGFARINTMVNYFRERSSRNEIPPVLFLNAGDTYSGSIWFTLFKENITAELLNKIKPDAMCLGNHEFLEGTRSLSNFLKKLKFPVVTANLKIKSEPSLNDKFIKNSTVFDRNGVKIGVIGYLTPDTMRASTEIAKSVEISDEIQAINYEAQKLKSAGVDIIIGLGHSGLEKDQIIAAKCPDLDLVIGAHSHSLLYNGKAPENMKVAGPYPIWVTQKSGRKVPVVQASAFSKFLGILQLEFDINGELVNFDGIPLFLNSSIHEDPSVLQLFEKYRPKLIAWETDVVGQTTDYIDGYCRRNECPLGNLFTDAMVDYASNFTQKPVLGLSNGGVIRTSIQEGNITRENLLNVFPHGNHVVVIKVNGTELLRVLEISVERYHPTRGRPEFLQMSGLCIVFDLSKPPGARIIRAETNPNNSGTQKKPIDEKQEYDIAMPCFMAEGGDGFKLLTDKPKVDVHISDIEVLANYLKKNSPITPSTENRIIIKNPPL